MRYYVLLGAVFFIVFGALSWKNHQLEYLSECKKVSGNVTDVAAQQISQKFQAQLIELNSQAKKYVDIMEMGFSIERVVEISMARAMLLESAEIYLNQINHSETLRPYLENRAFPLDRINIRFYVDPKTKIMRGDIEAFCLIQGTIQFIARGPDDKLKCIHSEPYSAAFQIWKNQIAHASLFNRSGIPLR